ncbi:MAG TPA: TonB-dependent receptor, partial [Magnetospirillum sp.]|nr:TonB-dependent receptor [Magnetospirillum sp.]
MTPAVVAAEPFVDTRVMARHSGLILPDMIPYEGALGGKTTFLYRRQSLPPYEPGFDAVAGAPKPVALMAGVSEGSTAVLASRLQAAGDNWAAGAAARNEDGHAYRDGAGSKVDFGYSRESEWLGARAGKPNDTQVTLGVARDVLQDVKLLNYGLDVDYLAQGGGQIGVETHRLPGWFNQAGAQFAGFFAHVDVNNDTLRQPAALRIGGKGDHRGLRANGWLAHDETASRTLFGAELAHQTHTARRYGMDFGPTMVTGYWVPGVELTRASTWAEHSVSLGDTKLEGGLRYDAVAMSAADLHDRPQTPLPFFNESAQQLYDRYYGANTDNDSLDHNISGRLRGEQNLAADTVGFVDLSRMVRSPDHTERYNGNGGPAALTEVGNPALVPEKHYKAALGGTVAGGGYRGYGRASGAGAWRAEGSLWHDHVEDFVTIDMARGQPGVLATGGGQVYRNVDAAISGVSADLQATLAEHLAVRLNLTGQRGRNLTDQRPLHQIPPLETNLFIDTFGGDADFGWNLGSRLRAVASKRAVDSDFATGSGMDTAGPAGGFATLDLYSGVSFGDQVAVTLGVDNVFDKLYREHLKATPNNSTGVMPNAPGRTV